MNYIPYVIEQINGGERSYDIYSRLLKDRIIILTGEITTSVANSIIAQLLFLAADDNTADIFMYINSPGGSITDGLAIFDTMNVIQPKIQTICIGMCASMAAFLLAAGEKGYRFALPNSEVMIHQPLGGASGQTSDVLIAAERLKMMKQKMNQMLAKLTGQKIKRIEIDTDRDYWFSAEEAISYGIVDAIITKKQI